MLQVQIANRQKAVPVASSLWRRMLRAAAPAEWRDARLSVAIVGHEETVELNRRFTGRTGDTDVLAFPLEREERTAGSTRKGRQGPPLLVGEIVVSASRAEAEARARGVRIEEELALYVAHGFLHLLGYDDHTPADRKRMYQAEERVLTSAGVAYARYRPRRRGRDGRKRNE